MQMSGISFCTTDWTQVTAESKRVSTGVVTWRTQRFGLRIFNGRCRLPKKRAPAGFLCLAQTQKVTTLPKPL